MTAFFTIVCLVLYFLPSIVASVRGHHQEVAIGVTNLLLGWTGIGWIAALIWSATAINPDLKRGSSPR